MENPYEGNYYQPYRPEEEPPREPEAFPGSQGFATASLVMGILSVVTICCFPPAVLVFAALGILFSCLSKGTFARSGPAKAGLAMCSAMLAIFTALVIGLCVFFLGSPEGKNFLNDYFSLFTSDTLTQEQLNEFLEKYGGSDYDYDYEEDNPYLDPIDPYDNNGGGYYYNEDPDLPEFYAPYQEEPESNFI